MSTRDELREAPDSELIHWTSAEAWLSSPHRVLPVDEAARFLGMSRRSCANEIDHGTIEAVHIRGASTAPLGADALGAPGLCEPVQPGRSSRRIARRPDRQRAGHLGRQMTLDEHLANGASDEKRYWLNHDLGSRLHGVHEELAPMEVG